ncbi:MAG: cation:proton antiporter [Kangiellaceae bacterium]|jgi:Kef-type K+ transport system membrane component KefB|nr:cation:proton antiporter [Kangiellaceae bacterium]
MDNNYYQVLLSIGGILLVGQTVSTLGRLTHLPRVTLLLLFGFSIGPSGLDVIPQIFTIHFELIADMTLVMVGFLIGGKLHRDTLNNQLKPILIISSFAAIVTASLVSYTLAIYGLPLALSIILGCIASATAPAAVLDVIMESNVDNKFSKLLISIVALDDAWSLILFAIGLAIATIINGTSADSQHILGSIKEIGGAVALGFSLGIPSAYLTGRLKPGKPLLTEAIGLVFICGGLAIWLEVSFLIASIVMGAMVANLANHHDYTFHEIENIEWPFMVVFFVLAGATLNIDMLSEIGVIILVYALARMLGKVLGGSLGAYLSGTEKSTKKWIGVAMLPQAGVAIGMALVASNILPQYSSTLLPLVIATTVLFELIGPIFTGIAIRRSSL